VVEVGEEVEVKVLEVDRDRERISLGLKQTRKDPWQEIVERVNIGEQIHGRVTKLVSFGAFVEVAEGVEGLIHISELAEHHVETPDEIVRSGDEVDARIIDVDAKRRRLSLSLRPKKEEREERSEREEQEERGERGERDERPERPRREDRFRRDYEPRGGQRDRDRDRGSRDRDRDRGPDRVGDGLRTGAFDALKDLDLGDRE
jgi:small subunit ribosomal protein S1